MAEKDIGGALDSTVGVLGEGVVRLGVGAALPEISAWEERLAAADDPDLRAVAETLGELRAQLDPSAGTLSFDPVTIGALLASLGDQVEQVAGAEVGAPVRDRLSRLGAILGQEGSTMSDQAIRPL